MTDPARTDTLDTAVRPGVWTRVAAGLFPGRRFVWIGGAIAVLLAGVLLGRILVARTAVLTGTNSVDVATVIASANSGTVVCIRDLEIPAGTGRIAVSMAVTKRLRGARLKAELTANGKRVPLRSVSAVGPLSFVEFSAAGKFGGELRHAVLCLRPHRQTLAFGGSFVQRLPGSAVTSVGGAPLTQGDIGVKYLVPSGSAPRVASAVFPAIRRASTFDSWFGSLLAWLAIPGLLICVYLAVRFSATAETRTVRTLSALAFTIAFVHGAAWAVLLQPFHGADESEHFAYAQYLATTDHRPDSAITSAKPPYSTSELRLMEAVHHNSTILNPSSRLRWDPYWKSAYVRAREGSRDDDGGGYTESATGHSPLYYEVIGLPYRVFGSPTNLPDILLWMRLLNDLMASIVAAIAVLAAAIIFRGNRTAAWSAGLLVGLQPVFGSIAGSVNNDTGVNLLAALLVLLLLRTWDSGPRPGRTLLTGACLVGLPLAKITGFALVGVVPIAGLVFAFRYGFRQATQWVVILASTVAVTLAGWTYIASPLLVGSRGALVNTHASGGVVGAAAPAGPPFTMVDRAEYFLQTFVPSAPLGTRYWSLPEAGDRLNTWPAYYIYIRRGYGLFGWKSVDLTANLLHAIFAGLAVGWLLALVALVRRRRLWRSWVGGVSIMVTAPLAVLAFVSYAYGTNSLHTDAGEQGRYVFTAVVPLAVLFSGAVLAFRGRAQALLGGLMAGSVSGLAVLAFVSALRGWYI